MMNLTFNRLIEFCLLIIALSIPGIASGAVALDFSPTVATVGLGEEFEVEVFISGLTDNQNLASYAIEIFFDDTVLEFTNAQFGNGLSPTFPDPDASFVFPPPPAILLVQENTTRNDLSGQPTNFFLFGLLFEAISPGKTAISFLPITSTLSDLGNVEIEGVSYGDDSTINIVPIPGAAWLLASALLGVVGLRKRAHRQGL